MAAALVEEVNPQAIARDEESITALRWIGTELRRRGVGQPALAADDAEAIWSTPLGRVGAGHVVPRAELVSDVPPHIVRALIDSGAWMARSDDVIPAVALSFAGGVPIASPAHQRNGPDMVYIGCEAPWLVRLAWKHGPGSGRAADLATGTGIVAVALSSRYATVVAADLLPEAVAFAEITLAINRTDQSATSAVVADVAAGLERGAFDLVTSNPPWVPTNPQSVENYLYGDGGPTGMELPRRFIAETVDLLAPGGTGIVITLDSTWSGDERPLRNQISALEDRGFDVVVEPAPTQVWGPADTELSVEQYPGCVDAQLVGLIFTAAS